MPELTGLRTVKLPVRDLPTSLEWYRTVFGMVPTIEFPDENGVVRGVGCDVPGGGGLSLRENPDAHTMEGLEVMLGVADRAALVAWGEHLDGLGVAHSPVIDASIGWLMVLKDPDGHEYHLYTDARHGLDQTTRPGYGRPASS